MVEIRNGDNSDLPDMLGLIGGAVAVASLDTMLGPDFGSGLYQIVDLAELLASGVIGAYVGYRGTQVSRGVAYLLSRDAQI